MLICGSRLCEHPRDFLFESPSSHHQGSEPMGSLSIDIGQSSQEKSNHFCVACVGSSHQRRHSSVGCRIKIGASIQKCPVDFNFAIQENCIHQSSHSIPVSGMHIPPPAFRRTCTAFVLPLKVQPVNESGTDENSNPVLLGIALPFRPIDSSLTKFTSPVVKWAQFRAQSGKKPKTKSSVSF